MNYSIKSAIFPEEIYSSRSFPIVVLQKPWQALAENEKALLERILGVAKVSLNHVQIVEQPNLDFSNWSIKPNQVIAFGLDTPGLSKNEILEVKHMKVIVTTDLGSLENADKETKQKLAGALKELFS